MRHSHVEEGREWKVIVPNPLDDLIIEVEARGGQGATVRLRHSTEGSLVFCAYMNLEDINFVIDSLSHIRDEIRRMPISLPE